MTPPPRRPSDNLNLVEIAGKTIDLSFGLRAACRIRAGPDLCVGPPNGRAHRSVPYPWLTPSSPYDPIRPRQHIRRNRHPYLFCRFQIDDELKLGRLFDGNVGGLGAFQDLVDKVSGAPV
jgi:hypothetical protein